MIDIQSIIAENLSKMIDLNITNILLLFGVGILLFWMRTDLSMTRKEHNKITEKSILLIIFMGTGIGYYLFSHQHYLILSIIISVILTYLLYWIGLFDIIVERWR